jgi:UrcA family protein
MADAAAVRRPGLAIDRGRNQGPTDMHTALNQLPRGARFSAPFLDSAVRRTMHERRSKPLPSTLRKPLEISMNKFITTAVVVVALGAAASVQAETRRVVIASDTLSFNTADLASSAGSLALLRRVERTAWRLCRTSGSPLDPHASAAASRCRIQAVARAVQTLDAPLVTAAFNGRGGRQLAAR